MNFAIINAAMNLYSITVLCVSMFYIIMFSFSVLYIVCGIAAYYLQGLKYLRVMNLVTWPSYRLYIYTVSGYWDVWVMLTKEQRSA